MKTRKLKEHRNTLNYIDNSLESTIINNKKKLSNDLKNLLDEYLKRKKQKIKNSNFFNQNKE